MRHELQGDAKQKRRAHTVLTVRAAVECVVGQRRLYVLESDSAVEAKLGRRVVKRCDGQRIIEDIVKPAKVRRTAGYPTSC
jgi:hypothetical protein